MTIPYKIAVIVGSLRKESFNRKVANAFIRLAPASLALEIVEIGDLPLYNEDLDTEVPPQAWMHFRKQMSAVEGVLFVTPEYNRSIPAVIKNALDVGSRPYGHSVWNGKPAAVASVSIGAIGGFGANHHVRQSLTFLNMPCMQQPEAYIGTIADHFDNSGQLHQKTEAYFSGLMEAYAAWVKVWAQRNTG